MFHDATLLILHGYPYPLPATDENIPSSATIPRYSIDAYMNCVDACYQTLKHKMNGRCGPASNFVDVALKFHCVDPTLMFVFRQKTHEFFVFSQSV